MRILYLACHSIAEFEEVGLLTELGHEVVSQGAYRDPRNPGEKSRPPLPNAYFNPELASVVPNVWGEEINQKLIDWCDCIFIHGIEVWLPKNWRRIKGKHVIFRSIGQSVTSTETVLARYRLEGLKIVRYSPFERKIPFYAGEDAIIRFYKDPDEYKGWSGEKRQVITVAQAMRKREPFLKFSIFEKATRNFPRTLYGFNNDDVSFWGGTLTYEELKQVLRENRVYFYTCLPPETLVFGNPGVKAIADLEVGEKVLTHNGEYRPVLKKFVREFSGSLIILKTYHGQELRLTPNHPVYAIRVKRCPYSHGLKQSQYCHGFLYCWYRDTYKHVPKCRDYARKSGGEWVPANELKKEDYIGLSFPTKVIDVESIRMLDYLDKRKVSRWHVSPYVITEKTICTRFSPTHILPRDVKVTPEFMRLIGYYLAEGSADKRNKYFFKLSFNRGEGKYIEDVCSLFKHVFGLEPNLTTKENVVEVQINSVILSQFFTKLCGNRASNKHLPQWMLLLPKEKQTELIKGFVNGDGHYGKKRTMLWTISPMLAYQFRLILFRLGIINSIRQDRQRGGTIKGRKIRGQKKIYVLFWSNNQPKFGFIKDGFFWTRIREVGKEPYNGLVYNLEVDIDNSYTTVGGTLHNCTYPAPYTMAWQEALMTGIPTVNIGPNLAGFGMFEVPYLIENGVNGFCSDSIVELRKYISMLLDDYGLAKRISAEGRKLALKLFDKNTIKEQWRSFFESLGGRRCR